MWLISPKIQKIFKHLVVIETTDTQNSHFALFCVPNLQSDTYKIQKFAVFLTPFIMWQFHLIFLILFSKQVYNELNFMDEKQ